MAQVDPRTGGFPWGSVLTGLLLLLIVGAVVGMPLFLKAGREERYRATFNRLKTLATAEADFRANDRDGNGVHDFWTGDVTGLYRLPSRKDGQEIRLIDPTLARADARPIIPLGSPPASTEEYFFQALDRDNPCRNEPDWIYRMDTDGSGQKVHNCSRFGFCAFPEGARTGLPIFIINENYTIWHRTDGRLHFNWPEDTELKYCYSRFDY